jgi:hypothetical protein
MVDFSSYKRYGPAVLALGRNPPQEGDYLWYTCRCDACSTNEELKKTHRGRYDLDQNSRTEAEWEDEQYMLCPSRVVGYILREKRWAQLQVNLIQEAQNGEKTSFDKVQLAQNDTKEFLLDLVKHHGSGNRKGILRDIVSKKDKSLVVLLYGELNSWIPGPIIAV